MSTGSPARYAEVDPQRPKSFAKLEDPGAEVQDTGGHDILSAPTPRQGFTRHYTSLMEHANAIQFVLQTPGGGKLI